MQQATASEDLGLASKKNLSANPRRHEDRKFIPIVACQRITSSSRFQLLLVTIITKVTAVYSTLRMYLSPFQKKFECRPTTLCLGLGEAVVLRTTGWGQALVMRIPVMDMGALAFC